MQPPGEHLFWHPSAVTPGDRERLLRQRGCVLWFTGYSGSGKSTLARALERKLVDVGHLAYVLDGDNVRHGLNAGLSFSEEDRRENLRRVAEVAKLFADGGLICCVSFISPTRESRARAREIIGADRFVEVYIAADLATCESRDVKGLYEKARRGEIPVFTGVSAPYEPPEAPDLRVDTAARDVADCTAELFEFVRGRCLLDPA